MKWRASVWSKSSAQSAQPGLPGLLRTAAPLRVAGLVMALLMIAGLAGGGTARTSAEGADRSGSGVTPSDVGAPGHGRITDPVQRGAPGHNANLPEAAGAVERATGQERDGAGVAEVDRAAPGDPGPAPAPTGVTDNVDAAVDYTGTRVRRFHYPGAEYVKVRFAELAVLPGDWVTVANPAGSEVHTYHGDPRRETLPEDSPVTYDKSGEIWAMSVTGDTAIVTLRSRGESASAGVSGLLSRESLTSAVDLSRYGVAIDKVAYGSAGTPGANAQAAAVRGPHTEAPVGRGPHTKTPGPARSGHEESVCGQDNQQDAACYRSDHPAEYARSRPVARLLINGRSFCTGWRVGPNNRMITNHHCLSWSAEARSTEVWFDYQCAACDNHTVRGFTKVAGAEVLATDRLLDYTLFRVDDFDAIQDFGYLSLDDDRADRGEEVYIPQHAGGGPKSIAMSSDMDSRGACRIESSSYHGYFPDSDVSYYCDTASGSSGSPVLSRRDHKVVALHHFGGCPNSGVASDRLLRAIAGDL